MSPISATNSADSARYCFFRGGGLRQGARRPAHATHRAAFTLLEVLVAMTLLSVTLLTLYQTFSSNIYLVRANRSTWKAMIYVNNELMRWERQSQVSVSVAQGEFDPDGPMAGYTWTREIKDEEPLPGVNVRKVELVLNWQDGKAQREYRSHIYVTAK